MTAFSVTGIVAKVLTRFPGGPASKRPVVDIYLDAYNTEPVVVCVYGRSAQDKALRLEKGQCVVLRARSPYGGLTSRVLERRTGDRGYFTEARLVETRQITTVGIGDGRTFNVNEFMATGTVNMVVKRTVGQEKRDGKLVADIYLNVYEQTIPKARPEGAGAGMLVVTVRESDEAVAAALGLAGGTWVTVCAQSPWGGVRTHLTAKGTYFTEALVTDFSLIEVAP